MRILAVLLTFAAIGLFTGPVAVSSTTHGTSAVVFDEQESTEIDTRDGRITVREILTSDSEPAGMPDASLYAAADGSSTMTAEKYNALLAGKHVDGFERLSVFERPSLDSTFNNLTAGDNWAARKIVVVVISTKDSVTTVTCTTGNDGKVKCSKSVIKL